MIEIIILSLLGLGGIVFGIDEATNDDNNSTIPQRPRALAKNSKATAARKCTQVQMATTS
jgi:hypothetical protein